MKQVQPIIPGMDLPVTEFAKDQDEYHTLPAWRAENDHRGAVLSRWQLSWRERLKILWTGNLYLWLLTYGKPLQPIQLTVNKPRAEES